MIFAEIPTKNFIWLDGQYINRWYILRCQRRWSEATHMLFRRYGDGRKGFSAAWFKYMLKFAHEHTCWQGARIEAYDKGDGVLLVANYDFPSYPHKATLWLCPARKEVRFDSENI